MKFKSYTQIAKLHKYRKNKKPYVKENIEKYYEEKFKGFLVIFLSLII
jgi:hypothetical protein